MTDPLAALFREFLNERIYLHNISARTQEWYQTTWKAFVSVPFAPDASDPLGSAATVSKARLHAFVVHQRERGVSARTVNTRLQALNAFARWLHEERGQPRAQLPLLRTEKRLIPTLTEPQIR